MDTAISADEKRWRAESDARVLAEAKVIEKDKERMASATAAAQRMADEQSKEAAAMRGVANRGKPKSKSTPQKKKGMAKKPAGRSTAQRKNTFNVMEKI